MVGSTDVSDVKSYILSSKYRLHVLEHLSTEGDATPTEIAEGAGDRQPHISRALSELREKGVVDLRVSEARRVERYYGLTERGKELWSEIEDRLRSVDWRVREPTTETMESVVELARTEFGEWLRTVTVYDGQQVVILHDRPGVLDGYSDEEIEQGLHSLILDHSMDDLGLSDQECWSEILHFEEFSILKVLVDEETRILISFGNAHDVLVPDFSETLVSIVQD